MSQLRYLCLFPHSVVLFCLPSSCVLLSVSLDCPFLTASSLFSDVYLCLQSNFQTGSVDLHTRSGVKYIICI
jgi:hypothetical protein